MASTLGVGDEINEQNIAIGPVRRSLAELVAPEA
jgi:hypothetical protein